jgi:hypothetical protein
MRISFYNFEQRQTVKYSLEKRNVNILIVDDHEENLYLRYGLGVSVWRREVSHGPGVTRKVQSRTQSPAKMRAKDAWKNCGLQERKQGGAG